MPLKVKIKLWTAVAQWSWGLGDDICTVCHQPFDGCPPDCKYPGEDCAAVKGVCGHAFHLPCINKWIESQPQSQQVCPNCKAPWDFEAAEVKRRRQSMGGDMGQQEQQQQRQ